MSENPYDPPLADGDSPPVNTFPENISLPDRLKEIRKQRKAWDLKCWLIGMGFIFFSLLIATFVSMAGEIPKAPNTFFAWLIYGPIMAIFLIGLLFIGVGPTAWFWFRKK